MKKRANRWMAGLLTAGLVMQVAALAGFGGVTASATALQSISVAGDNGHIWAATDTIGATATDSGVAIQRGLATDGQYLYFTRTYLGGNEVVRADLDFNNQVTLVRTATGIDVFGADSMTVAGGRVYWIAAGLRSGGTTWYTGGIFSVSATPPSSLASQVAPTDEYAPTSPAYLGRANGIVVRGGFAYFTRQGTATLNRVALSTPGGTISQSLSASAPATELSGLTSDGTYLYAGDDQGYIQKVALSTWASLSSATVLDASSAVGTTSGWSNQISQLTYSQTAQKLYFTTFSERVGQIGIDGSSSQLIFTDTAANQYGNYGIAVFAQPAKTVTFDSNGGTGTLASQSDSASNALTSNAGAITRTGYTFIGWNTAANGSGTAYANGATYSFASNVTLYAQWTAIPKSYLIDYDTQGGAGAAVSSYIQGDSVRIAYIPTRDGYQFDGWFLDKVGGTALGSQFSPVGAKDFTIYAHWTKLPAPPSVTEVTVNLQGSKLGPLAGVVDAAITLPIPTKAGFTFDGWFREVIGGVPVSNPFIAPQAGDYTLFAHWTPVKVVKTTKPKPKHK